MTTPSSDTIAQLPSPRSWLIASIAGLLCLFQLVLQSLPSVIRARIACGFSLSHAGFGGLSSSFYYPYILLRMSAGLLVLRLGAR